MTNTSGSLYIGAILPTDATYKYFANGQMDDVRMYNYELTPQQVQEIYSAGSAVSFGN